MDAGTAAGALERFAAVDGPMQVRIGLWNHGAVERADPLEGSRPLSAEERRADVEDIARFFLDVAGSRPTRRIDYRTAGLPGWRSTQAWPPPGLAMRDLWLAEGGRLEGVAPADDAGSDLYEVDFDAGSGRLTRWTTQVGTSVDYADRAAADARLLVYDGAPLRGATEVTGAPEVELWIAPSGADGLVIAYLEAVSPDGRVTYLTEGGLRLRHHAARSFAAADARSLTPWEPVAIRFPLLPLSVALPEGTRLRLALAGADRDTFARVPADGAAAFRLGRNRRTPSRLRLPMAPA
jgi:hypothetical protein